MKEIFCGKETEKPKPKINSILLWYKKKGERPIQKDQRKRSNTTRFFGDSQPQEIPISSIIFRKYKRTVTVGNGTEVNSRLNG